MKSYELFNSPYMSGVRPREFFKGTREMNSKKSLIFGNIKSFDKDFEKSKDKN